MKILIVEDEIQLTDALSELLKRNMYSVDTFYNGIDGLDNALTGIYDKKLFCAKCYKINAEFLSYYIWHFLAKCVIIYISRKDF